MLLFPMAGEPSITTDAQENPALNQSLAQSSLTDLNVKKNVTEEKLDLGPLSLCS